MKFQTATWYYTKHIILKLKIGEQIENNYIKYQHGTA